MYQLFDSFEYSMALLCIMYVRWIIKFCLIVPPPIATLFEKFLEWPCCDKYTSFGHLMGAFGLQEL